MYGKSTAHIHRKASTRMCWESIVSNFNCVFSAAICNSFNRIPMDPFWASLVIFHRFRRRCWTGGRTSPLCIYVDACIQYTQYDDPVFYVVQMAEIPTTKNSFIIALSSAHTQTHSSHTHSYIHIHALTQQQKHPLSSVRSNWILSPRSTRLRSSNRIACHHTDSFRFFSFLTQRNAIMMRPERVLDALVRICYIYFILSKKIRFVCEMWGSYTTISVFVCGTWMCDRT